MGRKKKPHQKSSNPTSQVSAVSVTSQSSSGLKLETAKTILETIREEYLSQERRHILLVSKTQTLATVSALLFTVLTAMISANRGARITTVAELALAFGLFGVFLSLLVLSSRTFHKIKYDPVLNDQELVKAPEVIMVNLAKTYHDAISKSEKAVGLLSLTFDFAAFFSVVSTIFGVATLWTLASENARMSDTKKPVPTSSPSPNNSPLPQTGSYGTDLIKKSETPDSKPLTGSHKTRPLEENNQGSKKK